MSNGIADDKTGDALVNVSNLVVKFPAYKGMMKSIKGYVHAIDDVSLFVRPGEALGVLGESGCGKTTLGRCIARLQKTSSGVIQYRMPDGTIKNVQQFTKEESFAARRQVQIIFQDPYSSFSPMMTVMESLQDPLAAHGMSNPGDRIDKIAYWFEKVSINPDYMRKYPHEFSGGQLQRVAIARALTLDPELIICDEPVSALDVSIQAQVLNLLKDIQDETGLSYIFIAHDLSVVEYISDRIAVMYLGKIVETSAADTLYENAQHPYTKALLSAVPSLKLDDKQERIVLSGDVPSSLNIPCGCRFHPRCGICQDICKEIEPQLLPGADDSHFTACHFASGKIERK